MSSLPENNVGRERLQTIAGVVPGAYDRPRGCLLAPRCKYAESRCQAERPVLTRTEQGEVRCFFPLGKGGAAGGAQGRCATVSEAHQVKP
jgi:dipeptide transport system ATP-binding protein